MNDLVEVRGTNIAFEVRNGVKVEYAAGDREARMRALGCPETILKHIREHKRSAKRSAVVLDVETLATAQGTTVARLNAASLAAADSARLVRVQRNARQILASDDVARRSKAARYGAIIAADAAQERKYNETLARAESILGIVCGRRSGAPEKQLYPYDAELSAALATQYPDHTVVAADYKTVYTKTGSGMKYSVPYEKDEAGVYRFGKPALGHPITLQDVS